MNVSGHGDSFWFVHFHPFFRNISSSRSIVHAFSLFFGTSTLFFFIVLFMFFLLNHVALCGSFVFGSVSLLFKFYAFPQLCPYVVHLYICMHVLHIIFACFFWISFADMFQGKHWNTTTNTRKALTIFLEEKNAGKQGKHRTTSKIPEKKCNV